MTTGDSASASNGKVLDLVGAEAAVACDVRTAVESGVRSLRRTDPVRLSADDPRETLAFVRVLREAAAFGVPISWRGVVGDDIDPRVLIHLAPPGPLPGEDTPVYIASWRHFWQPGLCYYRLGPDFVFIKDVRWEGEHAARYRLELDGVDRIFDELEHVVHVPSLDANVGGVLDDLASEHLVLRLGDRATLLPYRMRRWPVPALEV